MGYYCVLTDALQMGYYSALIGELQMGYYSALIGELQMGYYSALIGGLQMGCYCALIGKLQMGCYCALIGELKMGCYSVLIDALQMGYYSALIGELQMGYYSALIGELQMGYYSALFGAMVTIGLDCGNWFANVSSLISSWFTEILVCDCVKIDLCRRLHCALVVCFVKLLFVRYGDRFPCLSFLRKESRLRLRPNCTWTRTVVHPTASAVYGVVFIGTRKCQKLRYRHMNNSGCKSLTRCSVDIKT
jgi:flavoprotein